MTDHTKMEQEEKQLEYEVYDFKPSNTRNDENLGIAALIFLVIVFGIVVISNWDWFWG